MPADEFGIIGAGLAGTALAIHLAQAGRRVVLYERDQFPRDKLCGEFLSPESRGLLAGLGCWAEIEGLAPPRISWARFTAPSGRKVELPLPGPGFGVSRYTLDALLVRRAISLGVTVKTGVTVTSVERARAGFEVQTSEGLDAVQVVVGAHGRRGGLDRRLGRAFMRTRWPLVGLKRHHQGGLDLGGWVEIHAFSGGYCGMSYVEGQKTNVCMLMAHRWLEPSADWGSVMGRLSLANPALGARLRDLEPMGETLAVAEIPFGPKECYADGIFFVGDAAGLIAPLVGDGQAMALEGAAALADILSQPGAPEVLGRRWQRWWRQRFALRVWLALRLQNGLMNPKTAEKLTQTVAAVPGLGAFLARRTRSAG